MKRLVILFILGVLFTHCGKEEEVIKNCESMVTITNRDTNNSECSCGIHSRTENVSTLVGDASFNGKRLTFNFDFGRDDRSKVFWVELDFFEETKELVSIRGGLYGELSEDICECPQLNLKWSTPDPKFSSEIDLIFSNPNVSFEIIELESHFEVDFFYSDEDFGLESKLYSTDIIF